MQTLKNPPFAVPASTVKLYRDHFAQQTYGRIFHWLLPYPMPYHTAENVLRTAVLHQILSHCSQAPNPLPLHALTQNLADIFAQPHQLWSMQPPKAQQLATKLVHDFCQHLQKIPLPLSTETHTVHLQQDTLIFARVLPQTTP